MLSPFRTRDWAVEIAHEVDRHDCIGVAANREEVSFRMEVLHSSSGFSNAACRELSNTVQRIFFRG